MTDSEPEIYEYAGFRYYVDEDAIGRIWMVPVEGQHWAAAKDKHLRAARECYVRDMRRECNGHSQKFSE